MGEEEKHLFTHTNSKVVNTTRVEPRVIRKAVLSNLGPPYIVLRVYQCHSRTLSFELLTSRFRLVINLHSRVPDDYNIRIVFSGYKKVSTDCGNILHTGKVA